MSINVYGLNTLSSITNWFNNWQTIILFCVITFVVCYLFYIVLFTDNGWTFDTALYYMVSFGLMLLYGICLFWVSKYLLNLDLVYSLIFTVAFYASSITLLIVLRRWKIKRWIIKNIENINFSDKKHISHLDYICTTGEHEYLNNFAKDLEKHISDVNKYKKINIWKDENMNPKIKK